MAHSQGTGFVQDYLNSAPERAAQVARYVNLDGGAGGSVPDEVEALAIWGEGDPDREIPGGVNLRFADQAHTEVVGSPETFAAIYEFFLGDEPEVTEVVREAADEIEVSGRVQLFPENEGAAGTRLDIWEVAPETGRRLADEPEASFDIDETGEWGPFAADGDAFYELAVERDSGTHHVFLQRFVRSNRWVRVLTSEPGGLADSFWELSDDHANLVVQRNKELWGEPGEDGDLRVNGLEILNEDTSPRSNRTIGVFVHDDGVDGRSNLSEPVAPYGVPFLTGVDLFLPAADPPDGTIAVVSTPRGGVGPETVCLPNYASSEHRMSVVFNSFHQLLDPEGRETEGHANPVCEPPEDEPDPGRMGGARRPAPPPPEEPPPPPPEEPPSPDPSGEATPPRGGKPAVVFAPKLEVQLDLQLGPEAAKPDRSESRDDEKASPRERGSSSARPDAPAAPRATPPLACPAQPEARGGPADARDARERPRRPSRSPRELERPRPNVVELDVRLVSSWQRSTPRACPAEPIVAEPSFAG